MPETDGSGSTRIISRKSRDIQLEETHNIILRRHKEKTLLIPRKRNLGTGASRRSCFVSDTMSPALPCLLQPLHHHPLSWQMSSPTMSSWYERGPGGGIPAPKGSFLSSSSESHPPLCVCDAEGCISIRFGSGIPQMMVDLLTSPV